jgi:flagellar basal body-associated protein FliL
MDKKKIIIIGAGVGALAILGGFLYFSFKKSKGTTQPSTNSETQTNSSATTVATMTGSDNGFNVGSSQIVQPNLNLVSEIEKLNQAEAISSLITDLYIKKSKYKTSGSKNAVQAHIDSEIKKIES